MQRFETAWIALRSSLWFVPMLIVIGMVGLAIVLIEFEPFMPDAALARFPRLFGAGAEGTRAMLSAVASSMITVAGVVFSITIVALSLSSSQYSPRVLRNFMRDRTNKVVLGMFVGIYAYCLVVLRTIRGGDAAPFVPSLATFGAMVLAFVGIAVLIHFIHHVSSAIQAGHILKAIRNDALLAIERRFPEAWTADEDEHSGCIDAALAGRAWQALGALRSGYIQTIDSAALVRIAREACVTVEVRYAVGDFVAAGAPWLRVAGEPSDETKAKLDDAFGVGDQRTIEQDPTFGVQQIVDIAQKALSPAVNDPTTANMCLDNLGVLLIELLRRRFPSPLLEADGELRVIVPVPTFRSLVALSLDEIRVAAAGQAPVLLHMSRLLTMLAEACRSEARSAVLADQARMLQHGAGRIADPYARDSLTRALAKGAVPANHDLR